MAELSVMTPHIFTDAAGRAWSVIGFDDILTVQCFGAALPTVRMPRFQMGQVAAEILLRQIGSREALAPQKVVLDS